jgi:hypothetical protein
MEQYFDNFSKHFLRDASTDVADVEVLIPTLGDQYVAEGAHLTGITYNRQNNELDIELDGADHRAMRPKEVWAMEEDDGFVRAIEIVRDDDTKEIVRVKRLGISRAD